MRYVHSSDGRIAATIDSSGRIALGTEPGAIVGCIRSETDVFGDEAGALWLGRIDADGHVLDAQYQIVGTVDINGRVLDATGRKVGMVERPVDGAALILLVGSLLPTALASPEPPAESMTTMMDEVLNLAEEHTAPGIRKNYQPLTDADVLGTPHSKSNQP